MRCKCCGAFYLDEDTLASIFNFSECCPTCKAQFKPENLVEIFPMNYGLVEYHYVYENMSLTIRQKRYLSKYLSLIFDIIMTHIDDYDVFIYFDDDINNHMDELTWFIKGYKSVFLFSLLRKEVIYHHILEEI